MNSIRFVFICSLLLATTRTAYAYDAETHGLITYDAYQASSLNQTGPGSVVSRLGLDRLDPHSTFTAYWLPSPTDPPYYDNTAVSPPQYPSLSVARSPNEYERCQIENLRDLPKPWIYLCLRLGSDGCEAVSVRGRPPTMAIAPVAAFSAPRPALVWSANKRE